MAEKQKLQEPGNHMLCANSCGFIGSPTTLNLCSKCYKDHCLKEQQLKDAKLAVEKTLTSPKTSSASPLPSPLVEIDDTIANSSEPKSASAAPAVVPVAQANRCATCRRRVGLTAFKCRCGITFCGSHRYPEQHGCSFDYKAMGRDAIAKANPVVKGHKLDKI